MIYSLLLVAAIAAALFWYKRWHKLPADARKKFMRQSALWLTAIVLLVLVATGRGHWLMGVVAALLALAGRLVQLVQYVPIFKKIFAENAPGQTNQSAGRTAGKMSRKEAAQILGVEENASPEEIKTAHKKLMQKVHPDRGGSDALAKQINEARDVLLG